MRPNGFKMQLKPGNKAEYKRRHNAIWPELTRELAAAGVRDYAIYLDEETLTLYAHQLLTENETTDQLPSLPIVRKWWDSMAELMEVNPDNSPVVKPLHLMFYAE
jgi:L-rhamnose mutarotase